jgi:hypothetical protein
MHVPHKIRRRLRPAYRIASLRHAVRKGLGETAAQTVPLKPPDRRAVAPDLSMAKPV